MQPSPNNGATAAMAQDDVEKQWRGRRTRCPHCGHVQAWPGGPCMGSVDCPDRNRPLTLRERVGCALFAAFPLALILALLILAACGNPTAPLLSCFGQPAWEREYYEKVCATAGALHLPGTHTCVVVSEYINLKPPPRP